MGMCTKRLVEIVPCSIMVCEVVMARGGVITLDEPRHV